MRSVLFVLLAACSMSTAEPPSVDFDPTDPVDPTEPDVTEPDAPVPGAEQLEHQSSGVAVFSSDGERVYMVDPDEGVVRVLGKDQVSLVDAIELGPEPTRMTRRGADVWVTLRAAGEIVHLVETEGTLAVVGRAHVGAEPYDVVASEHTDAIYVSLSQEDAVVELHPAELTETQRWAVAGEPRWLFATTERSGAGDAVWVASSMIAQVTAIDPGADVVQPFELPTLPRFTDPACDDRLLSRRITGEFGLSWDGKTLYLPVIMADTLVTVTPAHGDTGLPLSPDEGCPQAETVQDPRAASGYGSVSSFNEPAAVGRFEPAIMRLDIDREFDPQFIHVGSVGAAGPSILAIWRSYPTGMKVLHGADRDNGLMVTMETANAAIYVDLDEPSNRAENPAPGFEVYKRAVVRTAAGPNAVLVEPTVPSHVWTFSWVDRTVERWDIQELAQPMIAGNPLEVSPMAFVELPDSTLPEEVQLGRELFFASNRAILTMRGFGPACSTCHADGRTDGFTWQFSDHDRQTPSLGRPGVRHPAAHVAR